MIITAGSINVTVPVYFVDDVSGTNTGEPTTGLLFSNIETGGSASYQRQGAARTDFALVTVAVAAAHTDGGFILIDDTECPGLYRLDVPDLAFATGVDWVAIYLRAASGSDTIMVPLIIDLTVVDLRDGVRAGLTALPNVVVEGAGGLYTRGTGAGQINQATNGQIDANQVRIVNTIVPLPNTAGIPDVNVLEWNDGAIPAQGITGVPEVDVTHFVATLAPTPAATGVPDVNATHWIDGVIPAQGVVGVPEVNITHQVDTVVPAPNTAGIPDVNVLEWADGAIPAQSITGVPEVDMTHVEGVATITEVTQGIPPATPGLLAMFGWWWAQWRNDSTVTSSERRVVGDDGVVRAKATMSDNGTTFSPGELISGP